MTTPYREIARATGALEVPTAGLRGLLARGACWLLALCGAKLVDRGPPAPRTHAPGGSTPPPVFPTRREVVSCDAVSGELAIVVRDVQAYGDRVTAEAELRRAEIPIAAAAAVVASLRNQIERYDESDYDLPIFVVDPAGTSLRLTRAQAAEAFEMLEQLLDAASTTAKPS